jgi:hypothetical protein
MRIEEMDRAMLKYGGAANQYGAGRRAATKISVEVDRAEWLPPPLKLNALLHL